MRTFTKLAICLALLLTTETGVPASETFVPLLTENTVLFIHVDFSKVDVDVLKTETKKFGDMFLTALGFDERSKSATLHDLDVELEKWDAMIRPSLELFTKELGITEGVDVPLLVFEFIKGYLRTWLPNVEGDKLVFRTKGGVMSSQITKEAARQMQCANNITQIVLGLHNYHDARGALPPLYSVDENGKPLHSWRVLILPFIEQAGVWEEIRLNEPWDSKHNRQFHDRVIPVYHCPSNPFGGCTYSVIAGEVFVSAERRGRWPAGREFQHITDGTSNTIAIVEVREPFNWMDPTADITLDEWVKGINTPDGRAGSFHPGGCNVGFFDGFARFMSNMIDSTTLRVLGTKASGKSVNF